jgi:hypothetical protein
MKNKSMNLNKFTKAELISKINNIKKLENNQINKVNVTSFFNQIKSYFIQL